MAGELSAEERSQALKLRRKNMADNLANTVLAKFTALNDEYNAIITESETDLKEYNDYCNQSDNDLSEKLSEIRAKISRVNEFMEYARAHATDLEEAEMAFETEMDALETLRSQIDPKSENDYHAETLYTKASAQKLIYEADMERTTKKINGSKVQAKRMLDHQHSELDARRTKHAQEFREYIASDEFKGYIKSLSSDAAAFNSSGTSKLAADTQISLGQRRVKLPVPMEFDEELSLSTGGVFNSAAKTIGVPFSLDVNGGCALYVEYDKRNESYMLGGIQRFLLNILKYYGEGLDGIFFADPVHYSADGLGHIAALSKGINSIIDNIPENAEALKARFEELNGALVPAEGVSGVKRVFVFHGYPEGYDEQTRADIKQLAENAQKYGAVVVVTHPSSSNGAEQSVDDVESESAFRSCADIIKTRNGGFYVEKTRDSLFWYSAPSDLPGDIRQTFIEVRRRNAAQNMARAAQTAQAAPVAPVTPAAPAAPVAPAVPVTPAAPAAPVAPVEVQSAPAAQVAPVAPVAQVAPAAQPVTLPASQPKPVVVQPAEVQPAPAEPSAEKADTESAAHSALPAYSKGSRALRGIPCGTDPEGAEVAFDLENVAFVCATARAGREAFLRNIIGGIVSQYHPDDVELWLADFSGCMGKLDAFSAPHVRYAVSGCVKSGASGKMLVRALIDRLTEVLEKRLALYRADASAAEYSPTLAAVIDGFTEACAGLPEEYAAKLARLFSQGTAVGMRFVLADEAYTVNGAVPAYFAGGAVRQGVAMSSADSNISALFDGIMLTPSDKSSVANIPLHHAFIRTDKEINGSYLRLAKIPELYPAEKLAELCAQISGEMQQSAQFEPNDVHAYLSKRPVFAGGAARSFDEARLALAEHSGGAKLLYVGTPCSTLAGEYPIVLADRFGGNVLARCTDSDGVMSAAAGAAFSWTAQGGEVVLAASCDNEQLAALAGCDTLSQAEAVSELSELCGQIKQIKSAIMSGVPADRLTIIIGADLMLDEMSTLTAEGFAGRYDARADLEFILSQGPRLGYHFMLISERDIAQGAAAASIKNVLVQNGEIFTLTNGQRTAALVPYEFGFDAAQAQDYLY